jgi:hypothetical protein
LQTSASERGIEQADKDFVEPSVVDRLAGVADLLAKTDQLGFVAVPQRDLVCAANKVSQIKIRDFDRSNFSALQFVSGSPTRVAIDGGENFDCIATTGIADPIAARKRGARVNGDLGHIGTCGGPPSGGLASGDHLLPGLESANCRRSFLEGTGRIFAGCVGDDSPFEAFTCCLFSVFFEQGPGFPSVDR